MSLLSTFTIAFSYSQTKTHLSKTEFVKLITLIFQMQEKSGTFSNSLFFFLISMPLIYIIL